MATSKKINRREFLGSAAAGSLALTVVPRSVIGGPGYIAPSDKLTYWIYRMRYSGIKRNGNSYCKSRPSDRFSLRS